MTVKFDDKTLQEYEAIAARYPDRRASLLPALWLAQREFGWLSPQVQAYVADLVGVAPVHVLEAAEFYTMYRKKPAGRYHVQVCQTVSCQLRGAEEIKRAVRERLGIGPGETTPDGKFSLQYVECLASCHTAPCLQVNDDYHENMTPEGVVKLLDELDKK